MIKTRILFTFLAGLLALSTQPSNALAGPDISVERATVVIDAGEASYVHYTVNELRQQIKAVTGNTPLLYHDLKEAIQEGTGPVIVIGHAMVKRLEGVRIAPVSLKGLGPQGFTLKSLQWDDDKPMLLVTGGDSPGTNYALMRLRQLLIESASSLTVSGSLNIEEKPRYEVRGIYLHQHWRYNYPYATWSWSTQDWKRALDIAAYMRVNLVMIWTHVDMIAPPLNVAERDYLADIREVIDYADRKRGIKIWLIEPPNVLLDAAEAKRLPMESRDYYAYHQEGVGLKNPGDAKDFEKLMANREALYEHVPNADGYGYIDSDPGGWAKSPTSELVDILVSNRKLLDQKRLNDAKLVYWMWASWGNAGVEENWRNAIRDMTKRVKGPWELLVCWAHHLKVAKEFNYLDRSVFFPYGVTEGEPSFPLTRLNFDLIQRAFEYASDYKGVKGIMANVQTYQVQLPNLYYFMQLAWSSEKFETDESKILQSLAKLIYPVKAEMLAEGWSQLMRPGSGAALLTADRIDQEVRSGVLGRQGTVGEHIFPNASQVVRDLVPMLRIHGRAQGVLEEIGRSGNEDAVTGALVNYFREMLDWQRKTGYFGSYGVNKKVVFDNFISGPEAREVKKAWAQYAGTKSNRKLLEDNVVKQLDAYGYTKWVVQAFTGQLFGTQEMGQGDHNPIYKELPPNNELRPWNLPKAGS